MGTQLDNFFSELQRCADHILTVADNEAIRHDLLVRPLLTSPLALGWEAGEVLSQLEMPVPHTIAESYYWRGAVPRKKRPDIVLVPYSVAPVAGVVEEKGHHVKLSELESHVGQLLEYQYLHRCIWGLLTDGEKWVLTKNHEIFHRFENLSDLKHRLADLQHCIGRSAILERFQRYRTYDLVYVRPSPSIIIVGIPGAQRPVTTLADFLRQPSNQGKDIVLYLYKSTRSDTFDHLDDVPSVDFRRVIEELIDDPFTDIVTVVYHAADFLLSYETYETGDKSSKDRMLAAYEKGVQSWNEMYPVFRSHADELKVRTSLDLPWLMEFCNEVNHYPLTRCSASFLKEVKQWCLSSLAPAHALETIENVLKRAREEDESFAQRDAERMRPRRCLRSKEVPDPSGEAIP